MSVLAVCLFTVTWLARTLKASHPSFARLGRPFGSLAVFYLGAPAFFAMALMDRHGWFSP